MWRRGHAVMACERRRRGRRRQAQAYSWEEVRLWGRHTVSHSHSHSSSVELTTSQHHTHTDTHASHTHTKMNAAVRTGTLKSQHDTHIRRDAQGRKNPHGMRTGALAAGNPTPKRGQCRGDPHNTIYNGVIYVVSCARCGQGSAIAHTAAAARRGMRMAAN